MGASGGIYISLYGPFHYQSVCQSQVNDQFTFMVLTCPLCCGSAIIGKYQTILANPSFQEGMILLGGAPWVAAPAVGVEVSNKAISPLPNDAMVAKRLPPLRSHTFE
jgi:hypothetical protein